MTRRQVPVALSARRHSAMPSPITPEQRDDLRSRLSDNLAAVRFAGAGESGDDNHQRASEVEQKAFAAAEMLASEDARETVREYSRAAGELMAQIVAEAGEGTSRADDDDDADRRHRRHPPRTRWAASRDSSSGWR